MGSLPYVASIGMSSLTEVVINSARIKYIDSVKSLGVTITPTLNWDLHVGKIQAEVYGFLKSLNFYPRSLSFEIKKQLVQTLAMPHFDYASVVYNHLDKTRGKCLQVAYNACVYFVTGYVPFNWVGFLQQVAVTRFVLPHCQYLFPKSPVPNDFATTTS